MHTHTHPPHTQYMGWRRRQWQSGNCIRKMTLAWKMLASNFVPWRNGLWRRDLGRWWRDHIRSLSSSRIHKLLLFRFVCCLRWRSTDLRMEQGDQDGGLSQRNRFNSRKNLSWDLQSSSFVSLCSLSVAVVLLEQWGWFFHKNWTELSVATQKTAN